MAKRPLPGWDSRWALATVRYLGAVLFCVASCTFDRAPLAPGGADAAAPAADAPPASGPDAAEAPGDGGACSVRARELALGVATVATAAGQSRYEPACAAGTGPEELFELEVPASGVDLVVDVVDGQPEIDSVIEVTTDCRGGGARCASRGRPGAGEVVVLEGVTAGTYFVAVDTLSGSGSFAVTAFLRGIVATGAGCSRDLTTSRCGGGEHCLGGACRAAAVAEEQGGNETLCAAGTVFTERGVFTGTIGNDGDVDVIALEPAQDRELFAIVHDGAGGCPADLVLELHTGETCQSAALTSNDDDGGPGPCPQLQATVPGGRRSWLKLQAAPGAPSPSGSSYVLVVDL
jgi:hypothetical protein